MKKYVYFIIALLLVVFLANCRSTEIIISGNVSDSRTGLPIVNAVVSDGSYGNGNSGITDNMGNYAYTTYCEEHTVEIFAEGYRQQKATVLTPFIPTNAPVMLNIELEKE